MQKDTALTLEDRLGRAQTTEECLQRMDLITSLMNQRRISRAFLFPADPQPDAVDDLIAVLSGRRAIKPPTEATPWLSSKSRV